MLYEERVKLFYYQYLDCFRNPSKRDRLLEIAKLNNATEEELKDVDCAIAQACYYHVNKDYKMVKTCCKDISIDNNDILYFFAFRTNVTIPMLKDQTSHLASNITIAKYYQNKDDRIEKYNKYIEIVANIAQVTNTGNIDTIIEQIL